MPEGWVQGTYREDEYRNPYQDVLGDVLQAVPEELEGLKVNLKHQFWHRQRDIQRSFDRGHMNRRDPLTANKH